MKIVFFSNYLNHHQIPLAEALNSIDGIDYTFVATTGIPNFRKKLGYQEYNKSYQLDVTISAENKKQALQLALCADVAIFLTTGMNEYIIPRLRTGKLTFEYSERWLKKNYKLNLFSKNLWKHQLMYYRYGRSANLYMLCASAYAANDYYMLQSYKNRCYKWGYFPEVKQIDIEHIVESKRNAKVRLMWCARFIRWKHPELAINLAKRLMQEGTDFELNMYGNGPLLEEIKQQIVDLGLQDYVHAKGNAPNEEIIKAMQQHHIFLFTSDQNEGWGAVANEAMSNGCTIVGSDKIGSVPYLIQDGINGLIFKSKDIDSLYSQVQKLLANKKQCEQYAVEAYKTIKGMWSPYNAAIRLVNLIEAFQQGNKTPYLEGPCSIAMPMN